MKKKVFVLGLFILVCSGLVAAIPSAANIVPCTLATDVTDTTSTAFCAATAAVRHDLVTISVTNNDASVGTVVKILRGSTLIKRLYAAPNGGGFVITPPAAIPGAINTAWNVQAETTSAQLQVSALAIQRRN